MKHKMELHSKRETSQIMNASVRMRVRSHLTSSIQQLFCSYMRDYAVNTETAYQWFLTDVHHSIQVCTSIYSHLTRVNLLQDNYYEEEKPTIATMDINKKTIETLQASMSSPNYDIIKVIHEMKEPKEKENEHMLGILDHSFSVFSPLPYSSSDST